MRKSPTMPLALALALTLALTSLAPTLATAGPVADRDGAEPNRFRAIYVAPNESKHRHIHERLTQRRVLERIAEFLSPLRLPRDVVMKVEGCDGDANAYYEDAVITICYEFIQYIHDHTPKEPVPGGLQPEDAVVGPTVAFILHEVGHAVFDLLEIPVLGREEDAADLLSAYLQLQLGPEAARKLILSIAFLGQAEIRSSMSKGLTLDDFSGVHGLPAQRYYNVLCMAYGFDAKLFADAVTRWHLPADRAETCAAEYATFERAYKKLIAPHLDPKLLQAVKARNWLQFDGQK